MRSPITIGCTDRAAGVPLSPRASPWSRRTLVMEFKRAEKRREAAAAVSCDAIKIFKISGFARGCFDERRQVGPGTCPPFLRVMREAALTAVLLSRAAGYSWSLSDVTISIDLEQLGTRGSRWRERGVSHGQVVVVSGAIRATVGGRSWACLHGFA